MAVKLHRCPVPLKVMHPCWNAQRALDEAGVDYEIVKTSLRRPKRSAVIEGTGQQLLPVIELADGTMIRDESAELVKRIKAGEFSG